jgi:predicted dehydrogenase
VKVGFIGCGGFVSGNHLPNVASNPNLKIAALCDLNQDLLAQHKATYQPDYVTTDFEDIFKDPDIGMVVCGTKPSFRLPIMRKAVEYGKPLFVEKPLCMDDKDIQPMVDLLRDEPIPFMIGFNRPYSPMMQDIRDYYRKLKSGSATVIYRIVGEAKLWPRTHFDAVVHGKESTIIHEVTHVFDLLNWLVDLFPTRVYTAGQGNLDNVITLNYPNDVTAVIIAGDNASAGFPKERLEINTGYNTIMGDHFTETIVVTADGKLTRKNYPYSVGGKVCQTDGMQGMINCSNWRQSVTQDDLDRGYYYDKQVLVDKGHAHELEIFRQIIETGRKSETNVIKAALAQLIANKAIASWQSGQAVDLDFSNLIQG